MRLTAPSSRQILDQRRERTRRRRIAAGALGEAFPAVEQVRVQLEFIDSSSHPPSGQIHMIYPSAPAYFEYACPYGDCDGGFDLNDAVAAMASATESLDEGETECTGSRAGVGPAKRPCELRARYRILAQYAAPPAKKSRSKS
jgi:hypothetical protein